MARFPRKTSLLLFAVLAFSLVSTALAADPPQTDPYHDLAIPLTPPTPTVTAARAQIQKLLARYTATKPRPVTQLTRGRQAILYGDLFRTGENYALVQVILPSTPPNEWSTDLTALALFQDGHWQLRGLWALVPIWRPPGWKPDSEDPLRFTPPDRAFHLLDLSSARSPEVIIPGFFDSVRFNIFRFSPKEKNLHLIDSSMALPERVGSCVILHEHSAPRATWSKWIYCRWSGTTLVPLATWHNEVPYVNPNADYVELEISAPSRLTGTFRIEHDDDFPQTENQYPYVITRDGQPYATVVFTWDPKRKSRPYNSAIIQQAWLLHHFTGLPRETYYLPSEASDDGLSTPAEIKTFLDFKRYGTVQVIKAPRSSPPPSPTPHHLSEK